MLQREDQGRRIATGGRLVPCVPGQRCPYSESPAAPLLPPGLAHRLVLIQHCRVAAPQVGSQGGLAAGRPAAALLLLLRTLQAAAQHPRQGGQRGGVRGREGQAQQGGALGGAQRGALVLPPGRLALQLLPQARLPRRSRRAQLGCDGCLAAALGQRPQVQAAAGGV